MHYTLCISIRDGYDLCRYHYYYYPSNHLSFCTKTQEIFPIFLDFFPFFISLFEKSIKIMRNVSITRSPDMKAHNFLKDDIFKNITYTIHYSNHPYPCSSSVTVELIRIHLILGTLGRLRTLDCSVRSNFAGFLWVLTTRCEQNLDDEDSCCIATVMLSCVLWK